MFTISVSADCKIGTFWFSPTVENFKTDTHLGKNSEKKSNKIQKILTAKNRNFCFRKEKTSNGK